MSSAVLRARHRVVGLLILLFAVTYLDRVCISVAGPRMQADLNIGPVGWGWVTAMFTLSYSLFELPTGFLGDRQGAHKSCRLVVRLYDPDGYRHPPSATLEGSQVRWALVTSSVGSATSRRRFIRWPPLRL
jgi:MFS family permease